jgi:uncharacterized damage-inducible protein DinB
MQAMNTLILDSINNVGYQLEKSFEGLPSELNDKALATGLMTPRETLAHLYEVYVACLTEASGGKHDWFEYKLPEDVAANPGEFVWNKRSEVVALAKADESGAHSKALMDFVVIHDSYHVGQICALRLALDPAFVPYSIYRQD